MLRNGKLEKDRKNIKRELNIIGDVPMNLQRPGGLRFIFFHILSY